MTVFVPNPFALAAVVTAFLSSVIAAGCSVPSPGDLSAADSSKTDKQRTAMVVTANPHATEAGSAVLRAGGSAVDAAVAIEAVLSLVEPQSSGLGGGGFMTYYDAGSRSLMVYDGRETAPQGANAEMFLDDSGDVMGYLQAKNSGLSIGVPGVVDMLALAHSEHGSLPWNELFDDAIRLADEGFDVSPRLASFFEKYGTRLIDSGVEEGPSEARDYFFNADGTLKSRLQNPEYVSTLELLKDNPRALYEGELAEEIVAAASQAPRAGSMALSDLSAYRARKLEALCIDYRELKVCGPPPPSSWVGVGMMLGLLDAADFPTDDRNSDWAAFTAAQRLAYADRDYFVADDTRVDVPIEGMLNSDYLALRATGIASPTAPETVAHGDPWSYQAGQATALLGEDTTIDYAGTTHFVVADQHGNVVSMTASVESIFGSARMAGGMFLNNQLTDFAKQPRDANGVLAANHAAGGKRPRSSMSPTIAIDESGEFRLATGSPGGNSILAYTAKTLVAILDWGLSPQEAIDLPNVVARGDTVRVETARAAPEMIQYLRDRGFKVEESAGENSGLSIIQRHADGSLEGGVDPRREGVISEIAY